MKSKTEEMKTKVLTIINSQLFRFLTEIRA